MLSTLINKYSNYLLIAGLTFWLFRPTGNDFYILFVLLFTISIVFKKQSPSDSLVIIEKSIITIIYISLTLITITLFMKFVSFGYHYLDLGYDHHLSINLLKNNEYYNKIYDISGFADHFSPSFVIFIYVFYMISATSFWLIFFKCFSLIIFSLLLIKLNKKLAPIILLSFLLFSKHNVSAINWEFDTTSLMPALISIIYFSIIKRNWLLFWIAMIFSLGLKENAGVIWVCYGIYFIFIQRKKIFGVLLIGSGLLYMIYIWYEVIPFFAQNPDHIASDINLFRDIPSKIKYIFMAYVPFFFLPFLNWRWLLFTLPALGINLIGKPQMYSGDFHYADILTALIAIASLATLNENYDRIKNCMIAHKILLLLPIFLIVLVIPESPMQKFVRYLPDKKDWNAYFELHKFFEEHTTEDLAIGSNISPLINRPNFEIFIDDSLCKIDNNAEYIVFYDQTFRNQVHLENCIKKLNSSKKWRKVKKYQSIEVYEIRG